MKTFMTGSVPNVDIPSQKNNGWISMKTINQDRKQQAKEKDIVSYLKAKGHKPVRISGANAQYFSPVRHERHPSMVVNIHTNRWKLFNEDNMGGDIIELVKIMENVSFGKAIDILLEERSLGAVTGSYRPPNIKDIPEGIKTEKVSEIRDISLVEYGLSRGIDVSILKKYCREVHITFPLSKKNPDRVHICIGFKNNSRGYELRNDYLRVSSRPKDITTIKNKGKEIYVFESSWDYLAFLSYFNVMQLPGTVHVLNGAGMIGGLAAFLRDKTCFYWGQNDPAGDKVLKTMLDGGARAVDCRYVFADVNDFNDYLISRI